MLLLLAHAVGCEPAQRIAPITRQPVATAPDASSRELKNALELLQDPDLTSESPTAGRIAYGLNSWIGSQTDSSGWTVPALTSSLPAELQRVLVYARIESRKFNLIDVGFLRETLWLRDIASWVSGQKLDPAFARWLDEAREDLGAANATRLGVAYRLFDWTVRNVQLDPVSRDFRDIVATPPVDNGAKSPTPLGYAPRFGVPGPGYRFSPQQLLLYGHGDFWQRSWLFMLLARQQGIDVAMLAIPGSPGQQPRPWCTAVLIDDRLFLFDSRLGLVIPQADKRGVVELADVIRDSRILGTNELPGRLDLSPQQRYPVRHADVRQVTALIDGSPHYLGRRMRHLQQALTGDQRMVLTTSPGDLAERLERHPGVGAVRIWRIGYDAILYRRGREETLSGDDRVQRKAHYERMGWPNDYETFEKLLVHDYEMHAWVFQSSRPLADGRKKHLRGMFFKQEEEPGAANYYLQARVSDRILKNFLEDPGFRAKRYGFVQRPGQDKNGNQPRVERAYRGMVRAKQSATYWIGLANYEAGRFEVALDWLQNRTLATRSDSPWEAGARYNVGRTLEALGRVSKARQVYFGDESAQSHGNSLRARWLAGRPTEDKN